MERREPAGGDGGTAAGPTTPIGRPVSHVWGDLEQGWEVSELLGALDRIVREQPDEARNAAHALIRHLSGQAKTRLLALQQTQSQLREIEVGIREVQSWLIAWERRSAPMVDSLARS